MKDEERKGCAAQGGERCSRRGWFRAVGRWTALVSLAGLAAVLIGRRAVSGTADDCDRVLPCRDCASLAGCGLQRARRHRQVARSAKG